jgi:hypothetical protein
MRLFSYFDRGDAVFFTLLTVALAIAARVLS